MDTSAIFGDLLETTLGVDNGNNVRAMEFEGVGGYSDPWDERHEHQALGTAPLQNAAAGVRAEGGASAKQTTYIDDTEWSATGRTGVSLYALSAVSELSFAFHRAASRLEEMRSEAYHARSVG